MCAPTPITNITVRVTQNKDNTLESKRYLTETMDKLAHSPRNNIPLNIIPWDISVNPELKIVIPAIIPIAIAAIKTANAAPSPLFQILKLCVPPAGIYTSPVELVPLSLYFICPKS